MIMKTTTQSLIKNNPADSGRGFRNDSGPGHARAFGIVQPSIEIQARVRFRAERERASLIVNGVPRARAVQLLDAAFRLPAMQSAAVEADQIRVDLHRDDSGRWCHHYGLATAIAMVSSLVRRAVPPEMLFLGDVDLGGGIRDVAAPIIDGLNDAIENFAIETPITVVLAPDSATWLRTSSTVRAIPCRSLAQAVASVWSNTTLIPS
jgi:hypothetical protein